MQKQIAICLLFAVLVVSFCNFAVKQETYINADTIQNLQTGKPSNCTLFYALNWQNQAGEPFTISNLATYQFISLYLEIISDTNFTKNTNATIYAYGAMSQSLDNQSLAYMKLSYDGAIPYPTNVAGITDVSLLLDPIPLENLNHMDINEYGPTVGIESTPISMTWAFAGQTHYPTLEIQYYNGGNITKQYTDAPIVIKSEQPNITIIVPTPEPTPTPPKYVLRIFPVGADENNIAYTALWSVLLILILIGAIFIYYLQTTKKPSIKNADAKKAVFAVVDTIIAGILWDAWSNPPSDWSWISPQGLLIGLTIFFGFPIIMLCRKRLFRFVFPITKNNKAPKPKPDEKTNKRLRAKMKQSNTNNESTDTK
jgi:hypothetical protein